METNVRKTLGWSECGVQITALAVKKFGHPKQGSVVNFAEFIQCFATNHREMADFLKENADRLGFKDYSSMAMTSENACLFSYAPASALEIIFRYLKILNNGGKIPSLWSFLDEDRKAVVHFVNCKGWYAEAFFACNEDFSVLHLLDGKNGTSFLPVVFTKDITPFASLADGYLQTYLPRDAFQFLSNKSGIKKKSAVQTDNFLSAQKDKGDML